SSSSSSSSSSSKLSSSSSRKKKSLHHHHHGPPAIVIPPPILPKKESKTLTWMALHPVEMARQLTLIEERFYQAVQPNEFLEQKWTKKDSKAQLAPNLSAFIERFNTVSRFTTTEIIKV